MNYINFKTGKIRHREPKNTSEYVEVDELMCPIILELNRKGYITKYCCQGHIEDRSVTYIMFEDWVKLPSIPENWYIDSKYANTTIKYKYSKFIYDNFDKIEEPYKIYNHLVNAHSELYDWVRSLPEYNLD